MSRVCTRILPVLAAAAVVALGFSAPAAPVLLVANARAKPSPSPAPTPTPTPTSAFWIHAFVAPTLDSACASPPSQGQDVQATSDGGFVVAGTTSVATSSTSCASVSDGWVGKLSATGQLQWQETLGCYGSSFFGFRSVQQTSDGGYILAGGEEGCFTPQCVNAGFGSLSCAVAVKLNSAGQLQWQQFYPGAFQSSANQIRQTSDGGYIVVGSTSDTSSNSYAWVAKLDSNGNAQWQKQVAGNCAPEFADANSVAQTSDGGYIVSGGFNYSSNCTASLLALRLDAGGNPVWQQGFAVGGHAGPQTSIQATADGGYALAAIGQFQNAAGASEDAALVKLNANGTIQWQHNYSGGRICYYDYNGTLTCSDAGTLSYAMRQTSDGGYVLAGSAEIVDPSAGQPAWLLKTDGGGNVQWEHDYYAVQSPSGYPLGSNFYGVAQAADGGFVAVGEREFYNLQANEVWVVKTDATGNIGACGEVHSLTTSALNSPLVAAPPALPVSAVTNPGENVTSASGAATGKLSLVQDC